MPTPLKDGRLDRATLGRLIEHNLGHSDGLVVGGTTGEAMSLTLEERRGLLEAAIEGAAGRIPILAGVGSVTTAASVASARHAAEVGADGLLLVTPPYLRPSTRALEVHFGAVIAATELPVVLYDLPSRTGTALEPELVRRLGASHDQLVAIKVATPTWERMRAFLDQSGLPLLCGDDALLVQALASGAVGSINVVGNLAPRAIGELHTSILSGPDPHDPQRLEDAAPLGALLRILALDVNPVPVKCALSLLGLGSDELRPPLLPLDEAARREVEKTLRSCAWTA